MWINYLRGDTKQLKGFFTILLGILWTLPIVSETTVLKCATLEHAGDKRTQIPFKRSYIQKEYVVEHM